MVAGQRRGATPNNLLEDGIAEMESLIRSAYPDATFTTESGEDSEGIHLVASVEAADLDEVIDVFIDRLIDLQTDHGLRLHVIPLLSEKT